MAVSVFEGNTADPATLLPQADKLRRQFGLQDMVLVGDRGMISKASIEQLQAERFGWITALKREHDRRPDVRGVLHEASPAGWRIPLDTTGEPPLAVSESLRAELGWSPRYASWRHATSNIDRICSAKIPSPLMRVPQRASFNFPPPRMWRMRSNPFSFFSGKCSSSQCSKSGAMAHGNRTMV